MIYPLNYNLTIEPDLKKFTFLGQEVLTFQVKERVDSIELDAIDLLVKTCRLKNSNTPLKIKIDKKKEKLIIDLPQKLSRGIYDLKIEFEGMINDKLAGFYRSSYKENGQVKYLATTQFEAADARRAFPCIDHPAFKATFEVSFIVDKKLEVISNTLPKKEINKAKKIVKFEKTPLMSTYLLYFGVGEFEMIKAKYKDIVVGGVAVGSQAKYTTFALNCCLKFLKFYEDYFKVYYPLKKLDLIAIPDFASGAMENWGAITFRENALLYIPGKSSQTTKQRIAEVVAHELVHQWFGNLVTMKWWDDLWLNESFATYMAYKAIDRFFPEWDIWSDYVAETYFAGMALDGLRTSHPIKVKVTNVNELNELFDEIAYDKGGSILRMLNIFLSEPTFKKGLQKYIKTFSYRNAKAEDLWSSLQSVSDKPIINIMNDFIVQTGFPLLTAKQEKDNLSIEQKRFSFLDQKSKEKWRVPIIYQLSEKIIDRFLFNEKISKLPYLKKRHFVNLNYDYSGFFIAQYNNELLHLIGKNRAFLKSVDLTGLLHDLFALNLSLKTDLNTTLNFIAKYLSDENDPEVLRYLLGKLLSLYKLIDNQIVKALIIKYAQKALTITSLEPKPKDNIKIIQLRTIALTTLNYFKDKKTSQYTLRLFQEFLKDEKKLHPDLWRVVTSGAVALDKGNYKRVKKLYENDRSQEEKTKLLYALGQVRNTALLEETLNYGLSSQVRFVNIMYILVSVVDNPLGQKLAYDWLVKNWNNLIEKTGGHSGVLLRRILKIVIPEGALGQEKSAREFLAKHKVTGLEKTCKQVLEELEINSRFVKKFL